MIELKVADYCHNCPDFEPDVVKSSLYSDGQTIQTSVIQCTRKNRCENLMRYLKREMMKGTENA